MADDEKTARRIEAGEELKRRWIELTGSEPGLRARDMAARLGVSEGELLAARVGNDIVRLSGSLRQLVDSLPALGRVMVLTRNETAVHERKGVFGNVKTGGHVGLVLNETIDLRLFFVHWRHAFAVTEEVRSGVRTSLQVFDASGEAVHKVYLLPESDRDAFDRIVNAHRSDDQKPGLSVKPIKEKTFADPKDVDVEAFRQEWEALRDVHEFHGLLRRHGICRSDAMALADPKYATRIPADSLRAVLEKAASRELPIMAFVGNRGCIQIHSGPINEVRAVGDWDNVLDPDFNLHVRRDLIEDAFVVRKPTADGIVTAVEFYDRSRRHVLQLFGVRPAGTPEREDWRSLTAELADGALEVPA